MKQNSYNDLQQNLKNNIFGQFIGVVVVSDSQFSAEYKAKGYKKVTRYNVQLSKKNFLEVVNTSTGAQDVGVEFHRKRDSYYESELLNGFFEHLKSNPDKKYIKIVWDNDKHNSVESCYVDGDGNILGTKIDDVKSYVTGSAYKKATEGYGREKIMREMDIHVNEIDVHVENIAELKVAGFHVIDTDLEKYIPLVR